MVSRTTPVMNGVHGLAKANGHTSHLRKESSPMAPGFMVSAPGKVIVFGEHAVVHGKAAMAAAISLRSYLLVTTRSKSQKAITLVFPDVGLDHTWNIDDLPWSVFESTKKPKYYDLVTELDDRVFEALRPFIDQVSPSAAPELRKVHQNASMSFLYLFLCLGSPLSNACIYTLRSTLPIGAGLGSSASICVCLSAALLKQIHVLAGPHPDQPADEVDVQLDRINKWAFVGELCIHGNPSGVDNTVSTRGKAVLFKREDYCKPPKVTPLNHFPELPLLLVNTKQSRSTATEVAKVATLKKKYPDVTEQTLNSIDKITMSAYNLINSDSFDPEDEHNIEHLGDLFRVNHGMLVSLNVSHPKLERIRELVDYTNIGWTKLTGAGGGGCAITLLKGDIDPDVLAQVQAKFEAEGFEEYRTTLGGDGVGILYPAVLHNGTDEKGGDEIDQQKFLNAESEQGIERLVGVGITEKRPEWKFWSASLSKTAFYAKSPDWSDVTPIPLLDHGPADQNPALGGTDPGTALATIAYSPRYLEAMSYVRALIAGGERSERVLALSEDVIGMSPSHYTIWVWRMECLRWLWGVDRDDNDTDEEMVGAVVEVEGEDADGDDGDDAAGKQGHHRQSLLTTYPRSLITASFFYDREIPFVTHILSFDAKNYHVWTYRQWLCRHFPEYLLPPSPSVTGRTEGSTSEIESVEILIDEDGLTRKELFADIKATRGMGILAADEAIVQREIAYAKSKIHLAPQNPSSWNYLKGVLRRAGTSLSDQRLWCESFVRPVIQATRATKVTQSVHGEGLGLGEEEQLDFLGDSVRSSHAIDWLAEIYADIGQKELARSCLESLGKKWDPIRRNYWEYRQKLMERGEYAGT
ncbi:hypothetical protein DV737_g5099, partial [Chaetothyriales sp. CBS 132003]